MDRESCIVLYREDYRRRVVRAFLYGVAVSLLTGISFGYWWAMSVFRP